MRTVISTLALLMAGTSIAVPAADAAAQVAPRHFDIPVLPMNQALTRFAESASVQLLFDPASVRGLRSASVRGDLAPVEALARILKGTTLEYARDANGVFLVRKMQARKLASLAPAASFAQPAEQEAPPPPVQNEDIIVTGSRVIQNGNASPTPVTVMTTQQLLEAQPTTVAAALQALPVFQGSLGQGTGTGGSVGGPNGSANAVNIRNLGLFRNLVLFNGRRVQPTSNFGLVTIDMLPQMLLQRVDVVTGGVSAVYGSDAISGVVNFITDRKFNGVSLKAQTGISGYGDDPISDLGAAFGTDLFGGRGHIEASLEYYDDGGIFDMSQRESGQRWALTGLGTAASPYELQSGVRLSTTSFGGLIRSGPLAGRTFSSNGVLTAFNTATDGGYYYNSSMKGSLRAKRAYGRFDFDINDGLHFYLEGFGALNRNGFQNQSLGFNNVTLRSQNPFLPAQYRYGTDTTTFTLSQIPLGIGAHRSYFDTRSFQIATGLEGEIGSGIKWNLSGAHGYSQQIWRTLNNINYQKLSAALDAVVNPATGQVVCNVSLTNPGLYPGCTPLNLFGPTAASAAALDYVTDYTRSWASTTLDELMGSVTASPFETWAGPVNIALSGEWRKLRFHTTSEVPSGPVSDCVGLRYNCTVTGTSPTPNHQVTFGIVDPVHQTVKELALEADIPLLRDAPLAQSVNVNLAGRYASYNYIGSAWTWKAGLDWSVSDELRVRATRSRDFRAPNLYDLYNAPTVSRTNVVDQLTGATLLNQASQSSGNPDLKPEVGNTLTAGIVYRPAWANGLSVSVDAYDIRITDAITTINGSTAAVQRQCITSNGTSPLCSLIVRPFDYSNITTANNATLFYNRPVNASSIRSRGIDFEANYATHLFDRPLSLRVLATWQPVLKQVTPGLADQNVAGYAYSTINGLGTTPKWRLTGFLTYSPTDEFRFTLTQRWRSSLKWNADPTLYYNEPKIPSFGWTNLNLSFTPRSAFKQSEFYINIQNLFDVKSPIATNSTANPGVIGAYISTDDYIGRYFTAGVKLKF